VGVLIADFNLPNINQHEILLKTEENLIGENTKIGLTVFISNDKLMTTLPVTLSL